jgi:predicted AAA+ superfamily ATPase
MTGQLIKRNIETVVRESLKDTPVLIIQGARQVGKSTLALMSTEGMLRKNVTLDSDISLLAARENPLEFVSQFNDGLLIIDEIQKCPELLTAIKLTVDSNRRPGRFLITGSSNILHLRNVGESLAGRAETIALEPFSVGEVKGVKEDFISKILSGNILSHLQSAEPYTRAGYAELVEGGGYPEARNRVLRRRKAFFKNYIARVLEHDVNELSGLAHLDRLKLIYALLAGNPSQIYIRANVSRKVGIPESSMNGYIRLLDDLRLINILPAWGKNYSKRAVDKPKIIVSDTGLACSLNGITAGFIADINNGNELGPLLEALVIIEIIKQQTWSDTDYSLFHYRDCDNKEVDLVFELDDGKIIGIEIKAASSFSKNDFNGLKTLREISGNRFYCGILLYTGTEAQPFGDRLYAAPVSTVWQ